VRPALVSELWPHDDAVSHALPLARDPCTLGRTLPSCHLHSFVCCLSSVRVLLVTVYSLHATGTIRFPCIRAVPDNNPGSFAAAE
jgi:hypothetical protein